MRTFIAASAACSTLTLAACGSSDALATNGVVARTVGHELTVAGLGKGVGESKLRFDLTRRNMLTVVNLWSSYHRLACAAAHNYTLRAQLDAATMPTINAARVLMLLDRLRRSAKPDTATEARYNAGARGLVAVRHILIGFPPNATQRQRDSVQRAVTALRRALTSANFAAMAARYSSDKRTATNGGNLGVLRKTSINPGMAEVIFGMRPGAISEPLASPLGADIVQRLSWADAKSRYVPAYNQATRNSADSAASDEIAAASDLRLMNVALDAARIAAEDPANHSRDTTVIATFDRGGKQTVADMLAWANTLAPEQRTEVLTSLPAVNDSIARYVVRSLVVRGVLLRAADSAKVQAPDSLAPSLRARFIGSVLNEWKTLGVSPAQLATGAKTPAERERLAAQRVDALFERGMRGQAPLPPVPIGVEAALDATYGTKLSEEGLQRAFEAAVALRGSGSTMQRQPVQ